MLSPYEDGWLLDNLAIEIQLNDPRTNSLKTEHLVKFTVTMKTPDALESSIKDAVVDSIQEDLDNERDSTNSDYAIGKGVADTTELCRKWFKYGEVVVLEIDTEKQTCTVLEAKR